jgi:hypothetical protein
MKYQAAALLVGLGLVACSFGVSLEGAFGGPNVSVVNDAGDAGLPSTDAGLADSATDGSAPEAGPACPIPNLFANGGFEQGLSSWSGTGAMVRTDSARSGTSGVRMCADPTKLSQNFPNTLPAVQYYHRLWIRTPTDSVQHQQGATSSLYFAQDNGGNAGETGFVLPGSAWECHDLRLDSHRKL